jgi:hypothetical protein
MKKAIVLLALVVLIGGCASTDYITRNGPDINPIGQIYYTNVNIWYTNPKKISSHNFIDGIILPIGTKVKILSYRGRTIEFSSDPEPILSMSNSVGSGISLETYFERYFSKEDTLTEGSIFSKLTNEEKTSVKEAKVKGGMSKESVLISWGYPPPRWVVNPMVSNIWQYLGANENWLYRISFVNGKVFRIEETEIGRKTPVGRRIRTKVIEEK